MKMIKEIKIDKFIIFNSNNYGIVNVRVKDNRLSLFYFSFIFLFYTKNEIYNIIFQLSWIAHIYYIKKKNVKSSRITLYNIFIIFWPYK